VNRRTFLTSTGAFVGTSLVLPGADRSFEKLKQPARPAGLRRAGEPVSLDDFEPLARQTLSHMASEYIAGGAGDEITIRWNREAFQNLVLRPKVLRNIAQTDTRVQLFGYEMPSPILLAPTAFQRLAHSEGEVATARGAGDGGATFVVSSFSTRKLEHISRAAKQPLWFQIYDLRESRASFIKDTIAEAEAFGCRALVVTVDAPVTGARNRLERAKFKIPDEFETPYYPERKRVGQFAGLPVSGDYSWSDVERVRSSTRLPLLLKGILNPDDAKQAVQAGVSGIIVSNHGGRSLDTVPATITALPKVVEAVAGRIPVLVDGGIRRGTDVIKALAFGARAVLIGRPYVYGLAVHGSAGVSKVIQILRREFEMAMVLTGCKTIAEIDRSLIWKDD
jgi:4-hydroxymandelate oxidase